MTTNIATRRFAFAGKQADFIIQFREGKVTGLLSEDLDVTFKER
jgi:hypothetical protein